MAVEYTNRRGRTYILHAGVTRTGKPRYYFSGKSEGDLVDEMPDGYEVHENPNGLVSVRKIRPRAILEEEIRAVKAECLRHENAEKSKVEVKDRVISVHEPDQDEEKLGDLFNRWAVFDSKIDLEAKMGIVLTFTPVLRFTLHDREARMFIAERFCFRGSIDGWMTLSGPEPLHTLLMRFVKHIGRDTFYELI